MKKWKSISAAIAFIILCTACGNTNESTDSLPQFSISVEETSAKTALSETEHETEENSETIEPESTPEISTEPKIASDDFKSAHLNFMSNVIKEAQKEDAKANICISAYSIEQALGMVANGANSNTKKQIEKVVGGLSVEMLNDELQSWRMQQSDANECFVKTANAVFTNQDRDDLIVQKNYENIIHDKYQAEYKNYSFSTGPAPINDWVSENTDGLIPTLFNDLSPDSAMVLANASLFEAKWKTEWDSQESTFTDISGKESEIEIMYDTSLSHYYSFDGNEAFVKNYKNDQYAFVGILPKNTPEDFINKIDASYLMDLLNEDNAEYCDVHVYMPEFTYDTNVNLTTVLKALGMTDAFIEGTADFSAMAELVPEQHLWIAQAIHKTHIEVDKEGTKAAAVTGFEMAMDAMAPEPEEIHEIHLNRPFVYMIMDTKEGLPLFIGTVNSLK